MPTMKAVHTDLVDLATHTLMFCDVIAYPLVPRQITHNLRDRLLLLLFGHLCLLTKKVWDKLIRFLLIEEE